jgi:hypothetical protein
MRKAKRQIQRNQKEQSSNGFAISGVQLVVELERRNGDGKIAERRLSQPMLLLSAHIPPELNGWLQAKLAELNAQAQQPPDTGDQS